MATKEEVARRLTDYHYSVEPGMKEIYRIRHSEMNREDSPSEPIKLLEINTDGIPAGILPLGFDRDPEDGIDYPYVIVEVTPDEFGLIRNKQLQLPDNWILGEAILRSGRTAEVA